MAASPHDPEPRYTITVERKVKELSGGSSLCRTYLVILPPDRMDAFALGQRVIDSLNYVDELSRR